MSYRNQIVNCLYLRTIDWGAVNSTDEALLAAVFFQG